MIAYQTAYLKAHYPTEFITALLNVSGNDVDRISFLIGESRRLGIEVFPPDINQSYRNFTIDGKNIRFGLLAVKNLGVNIADAIIARRREGGPYQTLSDFLSRVHHPDLNKKSLESLIKCGAFDSLNPDRAKLLANLEEMLKFKEASRKAAESNQTDLFGRQSATLKLKPAMEKIKKKKLLSWEKELLGLYLTDHPFSKYKDKLSSRVKPIGEITENGNNGNGYYVTAGLVSSVKKIFTKNGKPMIFAKLEDEENSIEILVFNNTLERNSEVWQEGKIVLIKGKLSNRDEEPKLICDQVKEL